MIKIDLPDNIQKITLEQCSENDNGEPVTHLKNSIYCFDALSQEEGNRYRCKRKLKSADGLYIDKEGNIYFFEFKNAPHNHIGYRDIHLKMHDSILTWQIYNNSALSFDKLMLKSSYFVIYNDSRFNGERENKSKSFDKIKQSLKKLAKVEDETLLWGVDVFKNTFYKEVHTIDVEVFEKKYAPSIFI